MNIAIGLLAICTFCAVLGIYRGLKNSKRVRTIDGNAAETAKRSEPRRQRRGRILHFIDTSEISRMVRADSDVIVFRIVDYEASVTRRLGFPGELAVTLRQFEETIDWIPCGSRIVVYRLGGLSPTFTRRIAALAIGRDVLFLGDSIAPLITEPNERGGIQCRV